MTIKFLKPVEDTQADNKGLEYSVDGGGVVAEVKNNPPVKQETTNKPRTNKATISHPLSVAIPLDKPPVSGDTPQPNSNTVAKPDAPKKRGRPSKSQEVEREVQKVDKTILSRQIFGAHQMLNVFIPGTAISEKSAEDLATALKDVMEAYDIRYNKKISSLVTLAATVAIVEVPVLIRVRTEIQARQVKSKAPQIVNEIKSQKVEAGKPMETHPQEVVNQPTSTIEMGEPFRG